MEFKDLITFIKKKWLILALTTMVFASLALVVSVLQPQKYRSEVRVLVMPKYAADVDPYAATRSTEHLSNLLSEIVYSQSFMDGVLNSGYGVSSKILPSDPKKQRKEWSKTISARVLNDTGIIDISVYNEDRYTTEQLAMAVAYVLTTNHNQYHSRGSLVSISTIDVPLTSLKPVFPNIPLNTAAGAALGFVAGLSFIYLFPSREIQLREKNVEYKMVDPSENNYSQPIAMPKPKEQNKEEIPVPEFEPIPEFETQPSMMYEAGEIKTPGLGKKQQEIGYDYPNN